MIIDKILLTENVFLLITAFIIFSLGCYNDWDTCLPNNIYSVR